MKIISLIIAITCCCFFFSSCHKDAAPFLTVSTNSLQLPARAGIDSVAVNSNAGWTLTGNPSWLTVSPASGNGDVKIRLSYAANNSANPRAADLILKSQDANPVTVHVSQAGATPFITTNKNSLTEPAKGQIDSLTISSNVSWNLSIPADAASWLSADKTSDTAGTTTIHLRVTANTTTAPKTAILTIASPSGALSPVAVAITQDQPEVIINYFTSQAAGGSNISISGSGFSTIPAENKVTINGVVSTVVNATPTSLSVIVPAKAGSGIISITVNTKTGLSAVDFSYKWTGIVTVIAGGTQGEANGIGTAAQFSHPAGIDIDPAGNIYVADYANYKVRKVTAAGLVTTLPGRFPNYRTPTGPNTDFGLPSDVAHDIAGNVYVVEYNSNAITKITPGGVVTILAGGNINGSYQDATGTAAMFSHPTGLAIDVSGNIIVTDFQNHAIRRITPSGVVTTVAGSVQAFADGTGSAAQFNSPFDIAVDKLGNYLITDFYNHRIRMVTPQGVVTTFAGSSGGYRDGTLAVAQMYKPTAIAYSSSGNLYFSDENSSNIRWITPDGRVSTIYANTSFSVIQGIAVDANENIYVADYYNNRICKIVVQ